MAIIYSYPTVVPTTDDLVLGTDVNAAGQPTKNFSISSIINLIQGGATGLGATITANPSAADANGVNQSATNFVNLSGTGSVTFNNFATLAGVQIAGTVGTGFTSFSSTAVIATVITGTLQTVAQPNVTSLGILTSLRIGNAAPAVTSIKTTMVSPGSDLALVTEKAIAAYIALKPNPETLAETLANGNITDGTDIAVSAGDDITFTDTSKALFGAAPDLEIFHNGTHNFIQSKTATAGLFIQNEDANIILRKSTSTDPAESGSMAKFLTDGAVELYFNANKKFETSNVGVSVTGAVAATGSGTFVDLLNVGTYQDTSGDVGTSGQILSSTVTGTNWIDDVAQYTWKIEGDTINEGVGSQAAVAVPTGSTIDFRGIGNVNTDYDTASKELRINLVNTPTKGSGSDSQVTYWGTGANLEGDSGFTFLEGDNHLRLFADGAVAGSGIVGAAYLTTYTGATVPIPAASPQWTAGVMTSMTSITSTTFIADALASVTNFQGNASSATRLGTANGTITLAAGVPATLGVTSDAVIYTSGGNITLNTVLADSTVTGKLLTGVSFLTGTTVVATDTILVGVGKLQKQITDLPAGLDFISTWDASPNGTNTGGTPDLTVVGTHIPGQYYIVAVAGDARPNGAASQPSEWKIGDWCIRGDNTLPSAERWQKIDNTSEVTTDGSGTANVIPKWNSASQLGASQIQDLTVASRTVTTIVDGGTGGDLTVQGNTILGNAVGDTILAKGTSTFEQVTRLNLGLSANGSEGSATQVLTSGGAGTAMSWESPTVGVVTSVTGGDGIKITGTAAVPIVSIDYLGADNAILSATNISSGIIALTDQIWFNDVGTGATANTLKYAPISKIKDIINTYSWKLDANGLAATVIAEDDQVGFNNGVGIIQSRAVRDITTALRYEDDDNTGTIKNFIEAAATLVNPVGADFLVFSDQAGGSAINKVNKATISSIVALGDQNLTQVLAKGSSSGGANSINMTGAISNIFLPDSGTAASPSTDQGRIKLGTGEDLQIYHNGANGYVTNSTGGLILEGTSQASLGFSTGESGVTATKDGDVKLYNDNRERLRTTSGGVEIVNTDDANSFPSITMTQDSKLFTITTGLVGNAELRTQGSMSLNTSGVINFKNYASTLTKGSLGDSFDFNPANAAGTGVVNGFNVGQSSDATAAGTLTHVYGDLQVDGAINHGGGKAGIFNGNVSYSGTTAAPLFTLTRTTTGQMIFDVLLTSGTAGGTIEKFVVAHKSNTIPVFNKVIGIDGTPDFTVAFTNATKSGGTAGDSVLCTITPTATQVVSYTVNVGFDNQNSVTIV